MADCVNRPSAADMYNNIIAPLFSANVLGGAPIIPESNEYYLTGNDLAAMELFYSLAAQQYEQTQDSTACCNSLIQNNAPLGLVPAGATFANVYIKVTGPASAAIPSNLQCQIGSNTYNLSTATNANPSTLDAEGNAILLMVALIPGADTATNTNTAISQMATISSITATLSIVPPGWNSAVIPQGQACNGNDAEDCEDFRTRVMARKKFQPNADFSYIREQALTWPCVTRVFQRTCGDCCNDGQLQLYAFMDQSFPYGIAPSTALAGLQAFIFGATPGLGLGKAPVGVFGNFFQVYNLPLVINFFNMTCITAPQFALIQKRLQLLFNTLVPGQSISTKLIDAIVIGVNPNCTNYIMEILPQVSGGASIDCNGNLEVNCDFLPTLQNVTYTSALPAS